MRMEERLKKELFEMKTVDDVTAPGEIWKPVIGYENEYLVSSMGRVYSRRRKIVLCEIQTPQGYRTVNLDVNGKHKTCRIHRLVAEAFIDNPENKLTVNHINETKFDNRAENLEWATSHEQNCHGTRIARAKARTDYAAISRKVDHRLATRRQWKPIAMLDEGGAVINTYESLQTAARETGLCASHISKCALGKRNYCGGFAWRYLEKMAVALDGDRHE